MKLAENRILLEADIFVNIVQHNILRKQMSVGDVVGNFHPPSHINKLSLHINWRQGRWALQECRWRRYKWAPYIQKNTAAKEKLNNVKSPSNNSTRNIKKRDMTPLSIFTW
jgi:hypothetical protein